MPQLPRRRSRLLSERFEPAAGRIGRVELVLARSLCRFGRFDLGQVPTGKRQGALRLKLQGWSPYREAGHAVVWAQGVASVWCWDAARLRAMLEREGRSPAAGFSRLLPETLLQDPLQDGLRLVRCMEGYDGQQWQAGQLVASRWWPELPGPELWRAFLRDSSVPPEAQTAPPEAQSPPLSTRPWARIVSGDVASGTIAAWEFWAYAALALGLAAPATVLAVRELQLLRLVTEHQVQLDALKRAASPLLQAREAALAAAQRIRAIDGLQRYPDPLAVMAAIAREMPGGDLALREWEMGDGKLRLLVASPSIPILGADLVVALEKTRLFADVKVITQADPKLLGLAMRMRSLRELEPAVGSAGALP